ncbi:MAG TPA: hypothetical protein ENK56_03155 [Chloroflexi bacterium]|nr:hypothetical protein [Chloroflexota bacterium]
MPDEADPPRWLWKGVLWTLTLMLAGGVALSLAIGAGWNSPRPTAPPDRRLPSPLELTAAAPQRWETRLLDQPVGPFTLEAVAAPIEGSDFSGYGLVFRARSPEQYAVFGVGPDGYLAVLRVEGGIETPLLDWQQFPHIRRGRAANRLRVSCAGGVCHFWVNDEYVAAVPDELGPSGDVGLWVRRLEGEEVRVRFEQVALWRGE